MSNNSPTTLFHLNIGTKILLTGFLRTFSVSRFNPSPRINQKSADGKTFSRLQKRPHLSSSAHSSGNQNILGCFSEVLPSVTAALFSIPFFSRQLGEIMRINNKEYPNVSLSVVSDRKEPGLTGMKKICLYEATIKCGKQIQKMRSEHLGELQSWIEREVEPKMTT